MRTDSSRIPNSFFIREVTKVAPDLLGKILVRRFEDDTIQKFVITETEAYSGGEDKACHANKGLTPRTKVMFDEGGLVYVYLIYGMYWMLNFVTGEAGDSSAVLIRGVKGISGPGRVAGHFDSTNPFMERTWLLQIEYGLKTQS